MDDVFGWWKKSHAAILARDPVEGAGQDQDQGPGPEAAHDPGIGLGIGLGTDLAPETSLAAAANHEMTNHEMTERKASPAPLSMEMMPEAGVAPNQNQSTQPEAAAEVDQ